MGVLLVDPGSGWRALTDAGDDAQDALAQAQRAADQMVEAHRIEQANRADLLWTHAALVFCAGALIFTTGLGANIESKLGLWTAVVASLSGMAGGLVLGVGLWLRKSSPSPRLESVGLLMLVAWDAFMVGCFTASVILAPPQFSWPWEAAPISDGRPYPIVIYLGLFALLRIHYRAVSDQRKRRNRWRTP